MDDRRAGKRRLAGLVSCIEVYLLTKAGFSGDVDGVHRRYRAAGIRHRLAYQSQKRKQEVIRRDEALRERQLKDALQDEVRQLLFDSDQPQSQMKVRISSPVMLLKMIWCKIVDSIKT
jgi:hypothetical protein